MKVDRTAELQVQNLKQREQGADKVATARNQEAQATDKVDLATPVRVGQQVIYVRFLLGAEGVGVLLQNAVGLLEGVFSHFYFPILLGRPDGRP